MRAIIAILPLASLLYWLNPTPADSAGTWTAGLKQPTDWTAARHGGDSEGRNDGRTEAPTLVSAIEAALAGLTGESSAHPVNRNTLPATTMLVDSAVVR